MLSLQGHSSRLLAVAWRRRVELAAACLRLLPQPRGKSWHTRTCKPTQTHACTRKMCTWTDTHLHTRAHTCTHTHLRLCGTAEVGLAVAKVTDLEQRVRQPLLVLQQAVLLRPGVHHVVQQLLGGSGWAQGPWTDAPLPCTLDAQEARQGHLMCRLTLARHARLCSAHAESCALACPPMVPCMPVRAQSALATHQFNIPVGHAPSVAVV